MSMTYLPNGMFPNSHLLNKSICHGWQPSVTKKAIQFRSADQSELPRAPHLPTDMATVLFNDKHISLSTSIITQIKKWSPESKMTCVRA